MKKLFLFAALAAGLVLAACDKDDDGVDMAQLAGKWYIANDDPNFAPDGGVSYTFDADGGYTMVVYDALADVEITRAGSWMVSVDGGLLTLTDADDDNESDPACDSSGQYFLLKLNSGEMKWREAFFGYKPPVTRLLRLR